MNGLEVNKIVYGDCLRGMAEMARCTVDCCVTDPPYGISFMNRAWDAKVPEIAVWTEVMRVLRPGGYLLCSGGTKTHHRLTSNIEASGFEIRDVITWHYASGLT